MREKKITCEQCGSSYLLEEFRLPVRDRDSINCEVCGNKLKEWNEAKCWSATLLSRGSVVKNSDEKAS